MTKRVSIEFATGAAPVQLNRPEKKNALDAARIDGLIAAGPHKSILSIPHICNIHFSDIGSCGKISLGVLAKRK